MTRLVIGSQLETGGIFDIDDLQIFSNELRDEVLLAKMPGKLLNQAFFVYLFLIKSASLYYQLHF